MSPNTARWQQQINSSFEALVNGATLSPRSADAHHPVDCSDWRYAVEDLRGVSLTIDDLPQKDWSLRHLEQRSDSRDSGLESDVAVDRLHVCPAKKPPAKGSTEDRPSQHATFSHQRNEQLAAGNIHPSNSPVQLHMYTEAQNCRLYDVLNKKKLHAALKRQEQVGNEKLTNGFSSYGPQTPDSSHAAVSRHRSPVSPCRDLSQPHNSKSKCFTR